LLFWPRVGFGWPLWVDAPSFDIDDHVGVLPVAPPGDDTQLLRACDELRRRPLKRSRPLWEMWFLPGLPLGNRQAHHGHGPSCPDAWPGLPSRVEVTMRLERVAKAIELVVIEMGVDPDTVRPILGAKLRELDAISEN
jgi:hypothetical protein